MPILAALLLLLALSIVFSLAETSFLALSRIRLRHLADQGRRRAKMIQGLVNRLDHFLATILLANNFVNIAFTSLATAWCVVLFGEQWGIAAATFGSTAIILIFAEITPKIAAAQHAEGVALWTAPFMQAFVWLLGPITRVLTKISQGFLRLMGVPLKSRAPFITEEEIRLMIEIGKEEGVLGEQERQLLHRIFEFGDTKVGEVLVPLDQIAMVSNQATHEQVLEAFVEEGYSRILVYQGDDRRHVVGVIHTHDLLHLWRHQSLIAIPDLIRPIYAVPPEKRVSDLLKEFQARKIQLAVVTAAQGQAVGMVTLEDLVEEIVGDIE